MGKGQAEGKGVHSSLNDGTGSRAETTWNRALELVGDKRQTLRDILMKSAAFTLNQLPGLGGKGADLFKGSVAGSYKGSVAGSYSKGQGPGRGQGHVTDAEASGDSSAPLSKEKQHIGDLLYPKIAKYEPDLAAWITGVMLEKDTSQLLKILENDRNMSPPLLLEDTIKEAKRVLQAHGIKGMGQGKGSNGDEMQLSEHEVSATAAAATAVDGNGDQGGHEGGKGDQGGKGAVIPLLLESGAATIKGANGVECGKGMGQGKGSSDEMQVSEPEVSATAAAMVGGKDGRGGGKDLLRNEGPLASGRSEDGQCSPPEGRGEDVDSKGDDVDGKKGGQGQGTESA